MGSLVKDNDLWAWLKAPTQLTNYGLGKHIEVETK